MAVRDIFKVSWKTFFNPAGWIDYEGLKRQNITIYTTLKSMFSKPVTDVQETYEQAMQRLGVTDEEAQLSASRYHTYAMCFFLLGIIVFAYAFFLLFSDFIITGFLLALAASALCCAQAFKYHFWAFQIRQRRLGVTFAEWKRSVLNDKGPSA